MTCGPYYTHAVAGDPTLRFLVRVNAASLQERSGPLHMEWTNIGEAGQLRTARLPEIEASLHSAVEQTLNMIPLHTHFNTLVLDDSHISKDGILSLERMQGLRLLSLVNTNIRQNIKPKGGNRQK